MSTVKIRRSGTTTSTPSSLDHGELAINYADDKLFWKDASNTIQSFVFQAYATATHTHSADAITSGTVAYARLPVGSTTSTVCAGDDARLSNARTPTAHKSTHATGGSDALTPSDIGAAPAASPTFTGTVTVPGLTSTGVILADDAATANSVVYSFDGDPNTGIGRGGADILTVVTAGSERVRVDSSGRVLIGATSGTFPLTVVADSGARALDIRGRASGNIAVADFTSNDGATRYGRLDGRPAFFQMRGPENGYISLARYDGNSVMEVYDSGKVRFIPMSSAPATANAGDVYYDSSTNKLRVYNGTSWIDLH